MPNNSNNYIRYQGSPDVFEQQTGKYISSDEANKVPNFYSQVQDINQLRPDVKIAADFQRLAGTNLPTTTTPQEKVGTSQPSPQTVQAQPFTNPPTTAPATAPINSPISNGNVVGAGNTTGGTTTPSKYERRFNQANTTLGANGGQVSEEQGRNLVNQYSPTNPNNAASLFVQSDPYLKNLVDNYQSYIDPKNQRTSLTDTYNALLKDSGIQAIDTQLINMKNVMEGTENDLRTEITKAGGFATNSQVLALTTARNKQLIKDYNVLLETRNAKEQYLNTAIKLEEADRQSASQRFEQQFNMGTKIAELSTKMRDNAVESLNRSREAIGWNGILQATQNDPYTKSLIEQTYGLPPGGLEMAATQETKARTLAQQKQELELQKLQGEIKTPEEKQAELNYKKAQTGELQGKIAQQPLEALKTKAEIGKIYADIQKINNEMGTKNGFANVNTPQGKQQLANSQGQIQQIGDLIKDPNLGKVVGPNPLSRISTPEGFFERTADIFRGGPVRRLINPGLSNAIASIEQLRSQLNLESLIQAKSKGATFGALSDQEGQMLANAATKIGTWAIKDSKGNVVGYNARESDFKKELDKINNFAKLDYILRGGNPSDVEVQVLPDGKHAAKNSDGSITIF